jgi:hypothetical protein
VEAAGLFSNLFREDLEIISICNEIVLLHAGTCNADDYNDLKSEFTFPPLFDVASDDSINITVIFP